MLLCEDTDTLGIFSIVLQLLSGLQKTRTCFLTTLLKSILLDRMEEKCSWYVRDTHQANKMFFFIHVAIENICK